jgi:hypothetical protein
MTGERITIGILVVLVILIVWLRATECEDGLAGFWTASPKFLTQAGLKTMYIYISPDSRGIFRKTRDMYIFAESSAGKILENFMTELVCWRSPLRTLLSVNTFFGFDYSVSAWTKSPTILSDGKLTLDYSQRSQALTIVDADNEVAGFLYKDPGASDVAKAASDKPADDGV